MMMGAFLRRVLVIAWKELRQLRRDRLTLAMMLALPIVQLLLFGYAINTDVRHIPTLVFDQDHSALSRDLARRLEATTFYDLVGAADSYEEIERAFHRGDAHVALVIPARLSTDITRGESVTVQLVVDGSDPQIVGSATSTAASAIALRSAELALSSPRMRLARSQTALNGGRLEPLRVEPSILYNPELRSAVHIVPGLVGVILTMTMVMLTAMAIARERERGTLEQLIVSPVRPVELIVGKIVPYIAMGYVQMTVIFLLGSLIFDVPINGSIPLLYLLAFVFIAANLAIGLFFSTLAKTQQQAMQMSFFFLLPNILLSGFMFPHEAMPMPARWLSTALPLTHFLRVVRGIVLKGSTFDDLKSELVWLVGILGVLIVLSSLRFRKKLV